MSKAGAQANRSKQQGQHRSGSDLIIRKMEPSFPFAIRSIQADGVIIIDFIGHDLKSKIDGYLNPKDNFEE